MCNCGVRMRVAWKCAATVGLYIVLIFGVTGSSQAQPTSGPALGNSTSGVQGLQSVPAPSAPQHLVGADVSYGDCYANLKLGVLTIGNRHVRRRWIVERDHLLATSLFDLDAQTEWMSEPIAEPSPAGSSQAGSGPEMWSETGSLGPTEAPSLRVHLRLSGENAKSTVYEFQVFAGASGVRVRVSQPIGTNVGVEPSLSSTELNSARRTNPPSHCIRRKCSIARSRSTRARRNAR